MEAHFKQLNQFYYDPTSPIGRGNYGTVYLAFHEENKESKAALKMIPLASILEDESTYNLLMREIDILRQLKGEHVTMLLDVRRTLNNLYIFMEYCDGGDLESILKKGTIINEQEACSIIKQISEVFVTLDDLKIVNSRDKKITLMHRDIKPANILFHQGKVKLADFGFAKIIDDVDKGIRMEHTPLGTPHYTCPQILNFEDYSEKCDVWSTGVLFYELLFSKFPWEGISAYEIEQNIRRKPLTFPKPIDEKIKDLITRMLKIEELERITWREVFEHSALNTQNDDQSQSYVL